MKKYALLSMTILSFVLTTNSFARDLKVKRVTKIGPMNNKVIYQSPILKKTKSKNIYSGKLIAQWGVHVFEVVKGIYECKPSKVCELVDFQRIATFESCLVKNDKVRCLNKISGDDSSIASENSNDVKMDSPDSTYDSSERRYDDGLDEFPPRIQDEYADIF